jgi:hypothetical protein
MSEEILFKNNYYPNGITKTEVISHYKKYKNIIIKETNNRPVLLFIFTDQKNYIVKRKINDKPIILNEQNYENILFNRVVSLSVEVPNNPNFIIIDVDQKSTPNEQEIKQALSDLLNTSFIKNPLVSGYRVLSSANSYHLWLLLKSRKNIDVLRNITEKYIKLELGDKYLINNKGNVKSSINLDISTVMKKRGAYTVPFALCRNGLVSLDVTTNWKTFKRESARV